MRENPPYGRWRKGVELRNGMYKGSDPTRGTAMI